MPDGIKEILASGQFPGVTIRGTRKGAHGNVHARLPANNYSGLSAAQQEAVDRQMMTGLRKRADITRRLRRGTKRRDGEVRHVGSIPLNLATNIIREQGREALDNPDRIKQTLAQHDCLFPS